MIITRLLWIVIIFFCQLEHIDGQVKKPNAFDPLHATIKDVIATIKSGKLTCLQLIKIFIKRIDNYNSKLNAIVSRNRDAEKEAAELDLKRENGGKMALLHCVPFLIKDNIDVKGLPTTGGVEFLKNQIPLFDSVVVKLLREQEAIIMGKSNMPPFACCARHTNSTTGGLSHNPYGYNYSTHGSSGGNTAGIPAGFAVASLGTETGMSIMLPSSAGNLYGARPLWQSVSAFGVIPDSPGLDSVGPMVRSVEDAALILDIIQDKTLNSHVKNLRNALNSSLPSKLTLGVLTPFAYEALDIVLVNYTNEKNETVINTLARYQPESEIIQLFKKAVFILEKSGASVVNVTDDTMATRLGQRIVLDYTACRKGHFETYFRGPQFAASGRIRSWEEALNRSLELQEWSKDINFSEKVCNESLLRNAAAKKNFKMHVQSFLESVDILIFPSFDSFPPDFNNQLVEKACGALIASYAELTSINVPIGFSGTKPRAPGGLPIGMTLITLPERQQLLFQVAYAFQKKFPRPRVAPQINSAVNLFSLNNYLLISWILLAALMEWW